MRSRRFDDGFTRKRESLFDLQISYTETKIPELILLEFEYEIHEWKTYPIRVDFLRRFIFFAVLLHVLLLIFWLPVFNCFFYSCSLCVLLRLLNLFVNLNRLLVEGGKGLVGLEVITMDVDGQDCDDSLVMCFPRPVTVKAEECPHDYLRIYDGRHEETSAIIATLCGWFVFHVFHTFQCVSLSIAIYSFRPLSRPLSRPFSRFVLLFL